jgi:hypothetical protein
METIFPLLGRALMVSGTLMSGYPFSNQLGKPGIFRGGEIQFYVD